MGVDRTDYIIYGFKMKPNDLKSNGINIHDDNKFLPYIEGHIGVKEVIVYDYMCGEYVVFGKLINRADGDAGTNFTTISFQDFFDDEERDFVTDTFKELFGEDVYNDLDEDEPQIFVFSHYS
jgi:hypothetical protein